MIIHVLSDGRTLESVQGYVVPRTAARLAYELLERMNGGCYEEIKERDFENDNMDRRDNMDAFGVRAG